MSDFHRSLAVGANIIHKNKFNYSKVQYQNSQTKVLIICLIDGDFYQTPAQHLSGKGCSKCGLEKIIQSIKVTSEELLIRANKKHNNKYDYSEVNFKNITEKVLIKCPLHGNFSNS